jgi:S-adenosylmethionine:tRNA ribosyltransferase-isomerase
MNIDLFDYFYDDSMIAKYPPEDRDSARLLAVDVKNFKIEHKKFYEITGYINKNDVVAVNNSYVKKARIFGKRVSGGKVEIFITEFPPAFTFPLKLKALLKSHKTIKESEEIAVSDNTGGGYSNSAAVAVLKNFGCGNYEILIKNKKDFDYIFERCAQIPLPPYLKREPDKSDELSYQTVYAKDSAGFSVAAPTAGLHFTDRTISGVKSEGGIFAEVSLNIGLGTFLPVRTSDIREHKIHEETYSISEKSADTINNALQSGNKIIFTGTSAVRCIESSATISSGGGYKVVHGGNLKTSLYIYPGYRFKVTKNLITNFHQPKSSLYIMVCALIGIDKTRAVYEEAVKNGYSLFSYGDAMYLYNI